MYGLLRVLQALSVSRSASPASDVASSSSNDSDSSVPGALPLRTPIDLFHQRYPRDFWRANTPQLRGNRLVSGSQELEAEADEDIMDYVLTEATQQDARSWCTAALNIADYNSVTGGNVDHPLTAVEVTNGMCFDALTLEMKHIALTDREMAQKNAAYLRLAGHRSPQGLKDLVIPVTGFERRRLETRFAHMTLVFDALDVHLERVELEPTLDAAVRRALLPLRREFGYARRRCKEEIATLDQRMKDMRGAAQRLQEAPTHYPLIMVNVFAPKGNVVYLHSDDDRREMAALYSRVMSEIQALCGLYPDYLANLQSVCKSIEHFTLGQWQTTRLLPNS